MATHDGLAEEIHTQAEILLRRCDDLKKFLAVVRLNPGQQSTARWNSEEMDARSLAVVCTMAELEAFTKSMIRASHTELNGCGLTVCDLRPSLRQLAAHTTFESLRGLSDHKKLWEKRRYATTLEFCMEAIDLPVSDERHAQPPLDGATLKPEHFNRIWDIYGIPGEAFPSASWAASMQKMAIFRNDVAHARLSYTEIFQQAGRSTSDVERYIDDITNFVIHLTESWVEYLEAGGYKAQQAADASSSA